MEELTMNSGCGCSDNTETLEIKRLSPDDGEHISLPHIFKWQPIENAYSYVLVIDAIMGRESVCIKETKDSELLIKKTDLDEDKNYLWHLEVLDDKGQSFATTKGECGTPISTFAVESDNARTKAVTTSDQQVLLDFSHGEADIQGLGVYNFSQYTAYDLLRKNGFNVGINTDRKLWKELLSEYKTLILHSRYRGQGVPFIPSEIDAIKNFVTEGGTLFVLCWGSGGAGDMYEFYNPLLKEFNIQLKPIPEPEFRTAENLSNEIFHDVDEIALQCPAEIVSDGCDILGSASTGESLLVRSSYGKGNVLVSGMGMAFLDSYMSGNSEREVNNQAAFVNLINAIC